MPSVFFLMEDGVPDPMKTVRVKDETKELQDILEHNHNLLPGEQIDPVDPCRWLLVKREMPVPDPSGGGDPWNIDFFFVDQNATPTFVECKRFGDTGSRRKVVGQVLEYAANGDFYWNKKMIREYAEESAVKRGSSLDEAWRAIRPKKADSVDSFLDDVESKLRLGEIRIMFFMEEAPRELKSIVDFLNKQMNRTEVLLVEARRYSGHGVTVIVPTLFGFTEEARLVKRNVTVTPRGAESWDWDRFFADARDKNVAEPTIAAMEKLYDGFKALSADIVWGSGRVSASFNPKWASVCSATVFQVWSSGSLSINFYLLDGSETATSFRDKLKEKVEQESNSVFHRTIRKNSPATRIPCGYRRWICFSRH